MLKGLGSSNPLLSANQSVHFAYILEKAETPREMWRSFSPQRTGESRLTPDSPDSASILSVRNKNGSLQRLACALSGVRPTIAFQETESLTSIDSAQLKTAPYLIPSALRCAGHSSGRSMRLSTVSALSSAGCCPWQIASTIAGLTNARRERRST